MAGTLLPLPRLGGAVVPSGALLYLYAAGTSTPITSYADQALTTPNSNPVVADSNGLFGPIYLDAISVKAVLKTSAGVTIWSQDEIAAYGLTALASNINDIVDGRLTPTSGTPVTGTSVSNAQTLYYTPYRGNRITLYNGSSWNIYTFSEISWSIVAEVANTNYDVFGYISSGVVAIERVAWTNATTRATNLTTQDGVLVKSGDTTRRYLGTYRTINAAGGAVDDNPSRRFVWNYYNRVLRSIQVSDATATWNYTTATWRQANNSTANQIDIVNGWVEEPIDLRLLATAANTNVGVGVSVAIGADSVTVPFASSTVQDAMTAVANTRLGLASHLSFLAGVGYHYFSWLEISAATGTTTWSGTTGNIRSGVSGMWRC